MKKIQIPLVILGLFTLLIPLGTAASLILAANHRDNPPSTAAIVLASIDLIFGCTFIYVGIRLRKISVASPKAALTAVRAWIAANIAWVIFLGNGHGPNLIAVGFFTAIIGYFWWALKTEIGED